MEILTQTYEEIISLTLSCYDRLIIIGSLPERSYGEGITAYFNKNEIRLFDYPKFAESFKESIRTNAEQLARALRLSTS